jgi:hypothetical protein
MLAPRSNTRLPSGPPRVVEAVVAGVLDLMIQSIEAVRDRVRRLTLR